MAKQQVRLNLPVGEKHNPDIPLRAWLFDRQEKLVSSAPVGKKGELLLPDATGEQLKYGTLHITPEPRDLQPGDAVTPAHMRKWKSYSPVVRNARGTLQDLYPVPASFWPYWSICWCTIRGKVVKTLLRNGISVDYPVCNAKVHVCEVDKLTLVLPTLPDLVYWRWRWEWLHDLHLKEVIDFDVPFKDPRDLWPPAPVTRFIEPFEAKDLTTHITEQQAGLRFVKPTGVQGNLRSMVKLRATGNAVLPLNTIAAPRPSEDLIAAMLTDNIGQLRATITANVQLFHPYFCQWPWIWPYLYRCTEIGTELTDEHGRFDILYNRCTDEWQPDVYVWVEYMVGGSYTTVYNPGRACHTHWDYTCGTEITVHLTDPRVPACGPSPLLPGSGIEFRRIGSSAFVQHVEQSGATVLRSGKVFRQTGLSDLVGGGNFSPFGATLPMKVNFTDGLLAAGITHYQWKYKLKERATAGHHLPGGNGRTASADNTLVPEADSWHFIGQDVNIGYIDFETATNIFHHKDHKLGPVATVAQPTYTIPQHDVIATVGAAPAGFQRFWEMEEFYCAFFDTIQLAPAGLYEVVMQLGKVMAGGFVPVHMDQDFFQVPDYHDNSITIDAPPAFLFTEGSPLTKASGFKILVRVDNRNMEVGIYHAAVDNGTGFTEATSNCGFLHYADALTSKVKLRFHARHPNDFGNFSFTVVRGLGNFVAPASASGDVATDTSGVYTLAVPAQRIYEGLNNAADLLGGCPSAAFAESLHTDAWATNGTQVLEYLDRDALAAFALDLPN
ncbi:MAG: hypothetical protein KBH07_01775 [Flavobacteriales bacterium]|nr:hypothetical protein [Flavobacteriales bacterium]MBP9078665.1 hypothetical protein [Flavobacteriales bacterium]